MSAIVALMVPVRTVMPAVLGDVLRKAPLTPEKVSFAWRHASGPAVARVTAAELNGDVLVVWVRDAAWRREIERAIPVLRPRLDTVLGTGVIRWIEVTIAAA